jgi:small nuclear ribonucleoprotein (snRNP)-like protein
MQSLSPEANIPQSQAPNFAKPILCNEGMEHPSIQWIQENVIQKKVRVTLKDKRIYHGSFECVDNKGNLCLSNVCAEHIPEYATELIQDLDFFRPQELPVKNFIDFGDKKKDIESLKPEELEALDKEFGLLKYSFPNVVIPGYSVEKVELQKYT